MIKKADLQVKKDWLVIGFDHERYCFDCDIYYELNKSLTEIAQIYGYDIEKLEEFGKDKTRYLVDNCCHTDNDLYYLEDTICKQDLKHLQGYYINALIICDVNALQTEAWKDKTCHNSCMPFCFGTTEKKYGLLDYKRTDMEKKNYD